MTRLRMLVLIIALSAVAAVAATVGRAETPNGAFSQAQQKQMQEAIRAYLLENREVILQSIQEYQSKQEAKAMQERQAALTANRDKLQHDAGSPVIGNPEGDVTIVEFFDYNCGYCKKMIPAVQELIESDKNIRFVFKEFPVLRPDLATAATAALAVWKIAPDKYWDYHTALMNGRGELNEERLLKTADLVGIDRDKLKAAMADPEIAATIRENREMGQLIGISGTPAFIIGDQLLPGALELSTMKEIVSRARAG